MNYFLPKAPAAWLRSLGWLLGLAGLLLALGLPAQAQVTPNPFDPTQNPAAPQMVRPDTATVRKPSKKEKRALAAADSARRTEELFGLRLTRPEKAGILALIPSGGQIYNKRYWKLPIVYGMVGGLGYWVWFQQSRYAEYRDAYHEGQKLPATTVAPSPATYLNAGDNAGKFPNASRETSLNNIYNNLTGYRTYRDLAILISALGYSLQILDAVVDAHLHDFDVSDNLSLNWQPTLLPVPGQLVPAGGVALTLRVK
jgi:hypothetical protein